MSKENQKTTSDFDALDPRERGYSPLSDPKGEVETEKASRFAKRFFLVSPIYGFAEGVRLSLDVVSYNKSTPQYSIFSPADK